MRNLRFTDFRLTIWQHLLLFVVLLGGQWTIIYGQTKAVQDALYIYRNDGQFNAFFFDDIDRFEYSRIDTLGREHSDYVVQEVYALDTLYRIPITAIDSVAFVTPETVYRDGVTHTNESELWNYVIAGDTTVFILSPSIPQSLIPKVGDKLVRYDETPNLPIGVFGQVTEVYSMPAGTAITFEPVELEQLFVQYVGKASMEGYTDDADASRPTTRSGDTYDNDTTLDPIQFSGSLNDWAQLLAMYKAGPVTTLFSGNGSIAYDIRRKLSLRAFYALGPAGINLAVTSRTEVTTKSTVKNSDSITLRFDQPITKKEVWLKPTPLFALVNFGFSANMNVSGAFEYDIDAKNSYYHSFSYTTQVAEWNLGLPVYSAYPSISATGSSHTLKDDTRFFTTGNSVSGMIGFYSSVGVQDIIECTKQHLKQKSQTSSRETASRRAGLTDKAALDLTLRADIAFRQQSGYTSSKPIIDYLPESYYEGATAGYEAFSQGANVKRSLGVTGKIIFKFLYIVGRTWTPFDKVIWEKRGSYLPFVASTNADWQDAARQLSARATLGGTTSYGYTFNGAYPGFALYKDNKLQNSQFNEAEYVETETGNAQYVKMFFKNLDDGVYDLYPAFRYAGGEYLAKPAVVAVVGTPQVAFSPEEMIFPSDGGTLTLTPELKLYNKLEATDRGDGYDDWWSYKKNSDGKYTITAKANEDGTERDSYIEFEASVPGTNPLLSEKKKVNIRQEGLSVLSVTPLTMDVQGYNTSNFKSGEYGTSISVTYLKDATAVNVNSSDKSWLKVYEWEGSPTTEGQYTTAERKIAVTPNISFTKAREGTLTVTARYDNKVYEKTVDVTQRPMVPTLKLSDEVVTLEAYSAPGADYSDTQTVTITECNLLDEALRPYVKSAEPKSSEGWLEVTPGDGSFTLRALAYDGDAVRTATVTYTITMTDGGTISRSVSVRQKSAEQPVAVFTLSPYPIRFPVEGSDITVSVVGDNIEKIKSVDCHGLSWLGYVQGNKTFTLSAKANDNPDERRADFDVTVVMTDGTTVTQHFLAYQDGTAGNPSVTPDVLTFPVEGGAQFVNYTFGKYGWLRRIIPEESQKRVKAGWSADYKSTNRYKNELYVSMAPNTSGVATADTIYMCFTPTKDDPIEEAYRIPILVKQNSGDFQLQDMLKILAGTWHENITDNLGGVEDYVMRINADGTFTETQKYERTSSSPVSWENNYEGTIEITSYEHTSGMHIYMNATKRYRNVKTGNTYTKNLFYEVYPHFMRHNGRYFDRL